MRVDGGCEGKVVNIQRVGRRNWLNLDCCEENDTCLLGHASEWVRIAVTEDDLFLLGHAYCVHPFLRLLLLNEALWSCDILLILLKTTMFVKRNVFC